MRRMYSEKQLQESAIKGLENADVKVKTIKQSEPNYLFEFEVDVEDTTNFERIGNQYCRIEEVNGEIHIIMLARFHNKDTGNVRSTRLSQFDISNIPEDISSKIYGYNGPLNQADAGIIRVAPMGVEGGTIVTIKPCRLMGLTANTITCYQPDATSVPANGYLSFSMEVNLSIV